MFGSLLDREAGFFRFAPFGINHPTARAYVPGTNVLETTWKTPQRLDRRARRADDGAAETTRTRSRRTHGRRRTTTPTTCSSARSSASRAASRSSSSASRSSTTAARPAEWTLVDGDRHTADATGAGQTIRLQSDLALGIEGDRIRGATRARARRQGVLRALVGRGARRAAGRRGGGGQAGGDRRYWRAWLQRARIPDHRWRDPIQRSALAIKGLTYMPTGATVAALTTSLPETPGGERNWDYRYTWIRDSTFTLQALHWLNLNWEADEYMQFVADVEPTEDGSLQIMYGIDGRRDLTESTRDDLSGYAGARPGADRQRRLRPAPERRLRRRARLDPAPHAPQPAPAAAALADRPDAGRVRDPRLAGARPGDLGGARQAAALRVLEAHVLGRARPRRAAGGDPRRSASCRRRGARPRTRSRRTSSPTASPTRASCASTTRRTRSTPRRSWPRSSASCPATTSGSARA